MNTKEKDSRGEAVATVVYTDTYDVQYAMFWHGPRVPEGTKLYLHPATPASAWRPIAEAPRDGTRILVTGTEIGTCVASAGWSNDAPGDIRWEVVNDIVVHPTEWQPLPPTSTKGG